MTYPKPKVGDTLWKVETWARYAVVPGVVTWRAIKRFRIEYQAHYGKDVDYSTWHDDCGLSGWFPTKAEALADAIGRINEAVRETEEESERLRRTMFEVAKMAANELAQSGHRKATT